MSSETVHNKFFSFHFYTNNKTVTFYVACNKNGHTQWPTILGQSFALWKLHFVIFCFFFMYLTMKTVYQKIMMFPATSKEQRIDRMYTNIFITYACDIFYFICAWFCVCTYTVTYYRYIYEYILYECVLNFCMAAIFPHIYSILWNILF